MMSLYLLLYLHKGALVHSPTHEQPNGLPPKQYSLPHLQLWPHGRIQLEHEVQTLTVHVWVSWEQYRENRQSTNENIKTLGMTIVSQVPKWERKEEKRGRHLKIKLAPQSGPFLIMSVHRENPKLLPGLSQGTGNFHS